ncbi:hypothetical protein J5Y04_40630 [Kitasatospora sp. RG8]|uniref:hypothetical protein n=1 Tax=Kitasatospora sp. RG8 TaxID=2820815 RepID=UPI001ADF55AF|nr:hypothetical protein [Kitasatospora sp. RG8]MBP0455785.1 hypothetical protein [Kitasatospora sp. RG8]
MRSAVMRGRAAMPERLRVDRQLEDAVIQSPGPFHLAGVSGLDEESAMRCGDSARALLKQAAER